MYSFNIDRFSLDKSGNTFVAEASDLQLRPGEWPTEFIMTDPANGNKKFGSGTPILSKHDSTELMFFTYACQERDSNFKCIIFND